MIEIYAEMGKKLIINKIKKREQFSGQKTWGKQEGWNSGIRNFSSQQRIDKERAQRKKKFRKKGKSAHKWGDFCRYRGIY